MPSKAPQLYLRRPRNLSSISLVWSTVTALRFTSKVARLPYTGVYQRIGQARYQVLHCSALRERPHCEVRHPFDAVVKNIIAACSTSATVEPEKAPPAPHLDPGRCF